MNKKQEAFNSALKALKNGELRNLSNISQRINREIKENLVKLKKNSDDKIQKKVDEFYDMSYLKSIGNNKRNIGLGIIFGNTKIVDWGIDFAKQSDKSVTLTFKNGEIVGIR